MHRPTGDGALASDRQEEKGDAGEDAGDHTGEVRPPGSGLGGEAGEQASPQVGRGGGVAREAQLGDLSAATDMEDSSPTQLSSEGETEPSLGDGKLSPSSSSGSGEPTARIT